MGQHDYFVPAVLAERCLYILDPDATLAGSMRLLFQLYGIESVCFADTEAFLAGLERRRPDAVVLRAGSGSRGGLATLRSISADWPGIAVLVFVDAPEIAVAVAAMKAGATDVIAGPLDREALLHAVCDILFPIEAGATRPPIPLAGGMALSASGFAQLTPREREVLELITSGQSNKEAGRLLGISPRTVEVHRARVMEKLGARNTADLMRIVLTG